MVRLARHTCEERPARCESLTVAQRRYELAALEAVHTIRRGDGGVGQPKFVERLN